MRKILATILVSLVLILVLFSSANAYTRVRGYYKPSTGRYIEPHFRTSPNRTLFDNWSTKGNTNPFTGKRGTVDPFKFKFR